MRSRSSRRPSRTTPERIGDNLWNRLSYGFHEIPKVEVIECERSISRVPAHGWIQAIRREAAADQSREIERFRKTSRNRGISHQLSNRCERHRISLARSHGIQEKRLVRRLGDGGVVTQDIVAHLGLRTRSQPQAKSDRYQPYSHRWHEMTHTHPSAAPTEWSG
jgi:hypothetical protein